MNIPFEKFAAAAVALAVAAVLASVATGLPGTGMGVGVAQAAEIPAPAAAEARSASPAPARTETVVFAGGCFWGVQGVFQHINGVRRAVSGYIGGSADTARYPVVSAGGSGHAEAVQVSFDPRQVSYAQLMQVFFSVVHDPTQLDRQGPDHGSQYRSAVFVSTPEQRVATQRYIAQLGKAGVFRDPIVTRVENAQRFYPAEAYHQDYLTLHPDNPYIRINDLPKVGELKRLYPALYRERAMLTANR